MTTADEIRDALAKMTPGEWQVRRDQCHFDTASDIACGNRIIGRTCSQYPQIEHDAAGIVTLRNKVPALLDELAAEKARADAWEADAARYASNAEYWKARADKAEAEVARLREALEDERLRGRLENLQLKWSSGIDEPWAKHARTETKGGNDD